MTQMKIRVLSNSRGYAGSVRVRTENRYFARDFVAEIRTDDDRALVS